MKRGKRGNRVRAIRCRLFHRRPFMRLAVAGFAVITLGLAPALAASAPPAGAAISHSLQANGSVDEAWLTGAGPGDSVTLLQNGSPVAVAGNPGTADSL